MYRVRYSGYNLDFDEQSIKPVNQGNEGVLYKVHPQFLVKVFKKHRKEKCEKVYTMMQEHPEMKNASYISWPLEMVFNDKGEPCGYLMRKFSGVKLSLLSGQKKVLKQFPNFTYKDVCEVGLRLVETVIELRRRIPNFVIGDFSAMNVLVNSRKEVCIIDADSIHYLGRKKLYPCGVSTMGFRAYETIVTTKRGTPYFSQATDSFSLAIIVFSLLSELHPYVNNAGKSFENCIESGICPLFNPSQKSLKPSYAFDYQKTIPVNLLQTFYVYFVVACRDTKLCPPLIDLQYGLKEMIKQLHNCSKDRYHYYIGNQCPFCKPKPVYTSQPKVNRTTYVQPNASKNKNPMVAIVVAWMVQIALAILSIIFYVEEGFGAWIALPVILQLVAIGIESLVIEGIAEALALPPFNFFTICVVFELFMKLIH